MLPGIGGEPMREFAALRRRDFRILRGNPIRRARTYRKKTEHERERGVGYDHSVRSTVNFRRVGHNRFRYCSIW